MMHESLYDDVAEWYDGWIGTGAMREDPFFPAVEALMGEVAGRRICDLACGQGRVSRYLADRGAHVVGVDLSAKLLAIARRHERAVPRGIAYLWADARDLSAVVDGVFDTLVCHRALMDIPDLASTLQTAARILRPGGWFVFSIMHPCYNPPRSGETVRTEGMVRTVGGYWDEGYWRSAARTGPFGKVGSYHRTLSTYVNALTSAGLIVERLSEPRATGRLAEQRSVWAEVPAVLVARCRTDTSRGPC